MNILDIQKLKGKNKITMLTCYDAWSAQLLADSSVDMLLVGDSLAMVMHGHDSTLPATVAMMELHTKAVAQGLKNGLQLLKQNSPHEKKSAQFPLIVSDLPFLSYRQGLAAAVRASGRLMRAGAQAVKLEGAAGNLEIIRHLVDSGIPVMGHIGLTPQSVHQLGGFKVQGQSDQEYKRILSEALQLQDAGCFSLVLECVPNKLASEITKELEIPTIGIGAGQETDGQVLVLQDMLGFNSGFKPKFLRHFGSGMNFFSDAVDQFVSDVKNKKFPNEQESY